jgi:RNA polymerase sigma-70 factor, ECF subfamily
MTPILAQRLRTDRSFERLYRRYVGDVYRYAFAVCRNAADAEDITQTTFLNAYRAAQTGQQPRSPKNWLLAIAHNVMRQRFRQAARRPDEVELGDGIAAAVPDEEGYRAEDIRRALGELAFNQRAALVMRELEGRSYGEIAEILSISVSAVETLIFRARRALREQLEGSLSCREAELAVSRQLDGRLTRADKGALRAHLRTCSDCASFARSQRAQRAALKGLATIPLPASLGSFFGGGAAVGTTVAVKAAAVTALGLLVAGGGVETAKQLRESHAAAAAPSTRAVAPRSQSAATSPPVAWALATQRHETRAKAAPTRKATKTQSQSHGQSVGNHGKANSHGQGAKQEADAAGSLPTTSLGKGRAVGRTSQHARGQAKRKQGARAAARRTATSEQHGRSAVSHGKAKAKGHADTPGKVKQSAPAPAKPKPAETLHGKPADGNQSGGNGGGSGNGKKSAAAEVDVSLAGVSVAVFLAAPGP